MGHSLREYTPAQVNENLFRMRDLEWVEGETLSKVAGLPDDLQKFVYNEVAMSKISFEYWANRYCHITDDKGRLVPLVLWPSQKAIMKLLAGIEEEALGVSERGNLELQAKAAIILLKSRQIGGTVLGEALVAHLSFFFQHARAIIASDHPDNSRNLWTVFLRIFDNLPPWMRPRKDAKVKATNLHLPDLDSDVIVGAGNQKTTLGQGMTIDCAHLTEVSTWENPNADAIDADLKPAFNSSRKHHSLFLIESTGAGGAGNWYHDQFQAARTGRAMFKAIFVGWFLCPDKWSQDSTGIELNESTQALGRRINAENGLEVTKNQLAWYQITRDDYEASDKLSVFLQEYPSSPDEAFQTGLRSVFSVEERTKVRDKCRLPVAVYDLDMAKRRFARIDLDKFMQDTSPTKQANRLVVWEPAKIGYTYIVGVDSSYGIEGADSSAIEVVRVGNKWAPDEQVAEWAGTISPADLSIPCWLVGHTYTDKLDNRPAKMAIESNPGSPGIVAQTDLMRRGYPHFYIYKRPLKIAGRGWTSDVGWWTTNATRPTLTEEGVKAINNGDLLVNSPWTVDEMSTYVVTMTPGGIRKLEHAPRSHDDRIMALFIARYVAHELDTRNIADARRRAIEQRQTPSEKAVQFAELGLSWDEAMAKWEAGLELFG